MPIVLGICILFGLLSSLLGTGAWYVVSWIAMIIPLMIAGWKIFSQRSSRKS